MPTGPIGIDLAPASGARGRACGFVAVTVTFPLVAKSPDGNGDRQRFAPAFLELQGVEVEDGSDQNKTFLRKPSLYYRLCIVKCVK